jgi:alkylhydroperoxidase family enzyme
MDFAEKVARDATSVTQEDVDGLRAHGLDDAEILDVVLAAAARAFLCKAMDGAGAQPDPGSGAALPPELREALTVGRPIAEG